jgi:hypothetical protein
MKIPRRNFNCEDGSATLTFTILLAIMMILFATNSQSLIHLHREIKLLDQQQIKRLNAAPTIPIVTTNTISK